MTVWEELKARGLIAQVTDEDDRWVDGGEIIFDGSLLKKK